MPLEEEVECTNVIENDSMSCAQCLGLERPLLQIYLTSAGIMIGCWGHKLRIVMCFLCHKILQTSKPTFYSTKNFLDNYNCFKTLQ